MKGGGLSQFMFSSSSQCCFQSSSSSGTFNLLLFSPKAQNPLDFMSHFRCLSTNLVSNGASPDKFIIILRQCCFKSGTLSLFSQNPVHFNSNFRRFSTNLVSNGTKSRRIEFGNINGLDDALSTYNMMIGMKPLPSVLLFNSLLSRLAKLKEYTVAASLFKDMMSKWGVPVNNYTLSIVINCYCNSHRVDFGFSVLGAFFKCGYIPHESTFSPLLKGLFRENRIAEAQQLFRKIVREELCQVGNFIFGVVVDGLCKAGNTAMAAELLRVMEKGSCRPDTYEYNMVIDSLM